MGLYTKTSQQMLFDLINASNPSLPFPVSASNAKFGTVSSVTPSGGAIQDTSVKVIALPGSPYVGNQQLTYRRLNATNLFRSVPLRIDLYSSAGVGSSPYKMSQLLPYINAKYGLNIQASDIVDANFPASTTNAQAAYGVAAGTQNSIATLTWTTTNYAWLGNINVCWVQAPQDLSTLLATSSLETALTYPGQRDVVNNTVYVPNLDTYYTDFTDALTSAFGSITSVPAYGTGGQTMTNAGAFITVVNALNAATGKSYTLGQGNPQGSQLLDLTSAIIYSYDLTVAANQALYPESDYKYFNRMLVIKLQAVNSWGAGEMMLHYNV